MTDRQLVKRKASEICRTAAPSVILAGLIISAVSLLIEYLSTRLVGISLTDAQLERVYNAYISGDIDFLARFANRVKPDNVEVLINIALRVLKVLLSAGFIIFVLNTIRGTGAVYGNLLDGFSITWRVLLLNLLEGLMLVLGSLLLVVPGIILAYAYRQAIYLLIDHPEKTVRECMRESRAMMKGHKWELFVFDLSFLGWGILSLIIPLADIWVFPYFETSCAIFYESVSGNTQYYQSC